jgi:hypothetical protein
VNWKEKKAAILRILKFSPGDTTMTGEEFDEASRVLEALTLPRCSVTLGWDGFQMHACVRPPEHSGDHALYLPEERGA